MAGNSLGVQFRITTWGESHGPAIGVVIDGCPAGLPISEADIQSELDRRRVGQSAVTSQRKESDTGKILSGVFEGKTTGAPIHIEIANSDAHSSDYDKIKDLYRPGHADYTYIQKYGLRDHRGGGRASARETAARVAAGAVAGVLLKIFRIDVYGYTTKINNIIAEKFDRAAIETNDVRCADEDAAAKMISAIHEARKDGDSLGGIIEVCADGVPAGLGEPVYDRLDADLAKALMSINAVKGVEIGSGFSVADMRGSENNDQMRSGDDGPQFLSNNSGGIDGGISNGNQIIARVALKPTPSILKEQQTIDSDGSDATVSTEGRHDPCICPRAVPVAEAMVKVVLADHLLRNRSARI